MLNLDLYLIVDRYIIWQYLWFNIIFTWWLVVCQWTNIYWKGKWTHNFSSIDICIIIYPRVTFFFLFSFFCVRCQIQSFIFVSSSKQKREERRTIINGLFSLSLSSSPIVYITQPLSLMLPSFRVLYKRKPCKSWNRPYFKQIWNSISTQSLTSECRLRHRMLNNGKHRHWRISFGPISIGSIRWSANYSDVLRLQLIRRKKTKWFDRLIRKTHTYV